MASKTLTSTPTSRTQPPPPAPTPPPPGTWQHPRLAEISHRRIADEFDERKLRLAGISGLFLVLSFYIPSIWPFSLASLFDSFYIYTICLWFFRLSISYKGFTALRPLLRQKDDMSDIALTPSQRALLGLGPASAPATPGSAYVTPPRYSRSTSKNYSGGSSRAATVGSDGLDRSAGSPNGNGTPTFGRGSMWDSPIAGSPLARKAMGKRASLGMGASIGDGGTPSPVSQRNIAVGLSNKFLYQKRVASNGGMTNYV